MADPVGRWCCQNFDFGKLFLNCMFLGYVCSCVGAVGCRRVDILNTGLTGFTGRGLFRLGGLYEQFRALI